MTHVSDLNIVKALEELSQTINTGISRANQSCDKAQKLLNQAWNKKDLKIIKEEIERYRQEIKSGQNALQKSQEKASQVLQDLQLAMNEAIEKTSMLNKTITEGNELAANLNDQAQRGRDYLGNLGEFRDQYEAWRLNFNNNLQQILETFNQTKLEIDQKSDHLREIQGNLENTLDRVLEIIGENQSFDQLITAAQSVVQVIQENEARERTLVTKDDLDVVYERLNALAAAQQKPWWWLQNWWWKPRISFSDRNQNLLR